MNVDSNILRSAIHHIEKRWKKFETERYETMLLENEYLWKVGGNIMEKKNQSNMMIYEDNAIFFRWNVPPRYNFAWDVERKFGNDKTKTALITVSSDGREAKKMTFWELHKFSNTFTNVLRGMGMKKGDRVLLMLPRSEEWYIAILGMIKLGIVAIPTTMLAKGHDIEYRVKRSESIAVITNMKGAMKIDALEDTTSTLNHKIIVGSQRQGWEEWKELLDQTSSNLNHDDVVPTKTDDPLLIYFTSGTTGNPKMVMHTHAYPLALRETAFCCQDLKSTDIIWTIADTGWAKFAWGKLFGQFLIGSSVLQWKMKGRFDPEIALKILTDHGVSVFCAPPTVYRMMMSQCSFSNYDFSELRHSMSAGEPLNPEVMHFWKEVTGNTIYEYYGQTETVALVSNFRCNPLKAGSMGLPMPGYVVDVLDEDGIPVPVGEEGYIAVKVKPDHPPGIFHWYLDDDEKTAEVFKGDWYITGDKAHKDEDGFFWFIGRDDDVIKASGYRIGPFEVESALVEHTTVLESAVIGVPDPIRGQVVKAFVVLKPGIEQSGDLVKELQDHVKNVTSPYKYPRKIEFVEELPKTLSGKIKRSELKKMELMKYREANSGFKGEKIQMWKEHTCPEDVGLAE